MRTMFPFDDVILFFDMVTGLHDWFQENEWNVKNLHVLLLVGPYLTYQLPQEITVEYQQGYGY